MVPAELFVRKISNLKVLDFIQLHYTQLSYSLLSRFKLKNKLNSITSCIVESNDIRKIILLYCKHVTFYVEFRIILNVLIRFHPQN